MDRARTVSKLVSNALRYRLLKFSGRPGRLEALSLEITHRCFCRCRMCNIWQIPQSVSDLSLSVWTRLLSAPALRNLRELDITGGEPFLRQDLGELLAWICRAKPSCFPQLQTLAITTNGVLTERILKVTAELIGPLRASGIDLVLACGLDAVGELHDRIRGLKGAWAKLNTTLTGLKQLRGSNTNLILGIKTTVVPDNVQQLEPLADFAREHELFTIISPCIITANRFGNLDRQEDLQFSAVERKALRRFYTDSSVTWDGHRQSMLHFLATGTAQKPCSAGFNTLFIRHNGEVFPCPLITASLGNIKDADLGELSASAQASRFRKRIGTFAECKLCTEPGLERIAWPYEGLTCLNLLARVGFRDFERLADQMGLAKYLA